MSNESISVEKYYVFRRLNFSDEAWGAVILSDSIENKLPNIDFGMKIFAENEKVAIARAKAEYDKIHKNDSRRNNVKEFAIASVAPVINKKYKIEGCEDEIAKQVMRCAISLTDEYDKFIGNLNK